MGTIVDLGPARVDLQGIRAGDRNRLTMTITQSDEPYDLTGVTVTAQARLTPTSATVAIEGTVEVTDATAGELLLEWPGDDVTAALDGEEEWRGVWDLQLDTAGEIRTIVAGKFTAESDVTRP